MFLILLILASFLYGVYVLTTYKFNYWKKKKVPHEKPLPLLGNYKRFLLHEKYYGEATEELCYKFPKEPYFGTYFGTEPALVVVDPEHLKLVLTKDFYYFNERLTSNYTDMEMLTKNIFSQGGDKWKVIRQHLTPLFSTSKMRNMFYLIENCARDFESLIDKEVTKNNNIIEAKFLMARFSMASIGSCAFGVETRTQEEIGDDNIFVKVADYFDVTSPKRARRLFCRAIWPAMFYALGMKVFPTTLEQYFNNLLATIYKSRGYKPSNRNDFIDLLLDFVKNKTLTTDSMHNAKTGQNKKVELEVNDELLVAQSLAFFLGGVGTSSTTGSFLLYELAKKPEAQKRLQEEVDSYLERHKNRVTYDCVTEMPFLEACLNETLRIYPILGTLTREATDDYTLPSGLRLEKGLRIHVPVHYLHRNADLFPDPLEFKPERFLGENKKYIKPYTYLPFGEGPRTCIGMRFAKMQMHAGIITVLKKYDMELTPETPRKMEFDPNCLIIKPLNGIKLKFAPRFGREKCMFAKAN